MVVTISYSQRRSNHLLCFAHIFVGSTGLHFMVVADTGVAGFKNLECKDKNKVNQLEH